MSFTLPHNFLAVARGINFVDGGGVTWTFNFNTNTVTAGAAGGSSVTANSVVGNGTSGTPLQLSGDAATPGNSFYYGTNSSGTKGWFAQPAAGTATFINANVTPDSHPASPSAQDDEFEGTSLDPKWVWVNQGAATASVASGSLQLISEINTGIDHNAIIQVLPSTTAYKYRAKVSLRGATATNNCGIILYEAATGKNFQWGFYYTGSSSYTNFAAYYASLTSGTGAVSLYSNVVTNGGLQIFPSAQNFAYLEVSLAAGVVTFSVSGTGEEGSFVALATAATATYFTPDHIGLMVESQSSTAAAVMWVDWFRNYTAGYTPATSGTLALAANPTASVGLTAVNGSLNTYMRSDAAPKIDLSIAPTWTGAHTWTVSIGVVNTTSGSGSAVLGNFTNATDADMNVVVSQVGAATKFVKLGSSVAVPLQFQSNNTVRAAILNGLQVGAPTGGDQGVGTVNATGLFVNGGAVYSGVPQNIQAGSTYTAVLADANKHLFGIFGGGKTFTIPANASVAYPVGTSLAFVAVNGTMSIAITTDSLLLAGTASTGTRTLATNGYAYAIKINATTWVIWGFGLT